MCFCIQEASNRLEDLKPCFLNLFSKYWKWVLVFLTFSFDKFFINFLTSFDCTYWSDIITYAIPRTEEHTDKPPHTHAHTSHYIVYHMSKETFWSFFFWFRQSHFDLGSDESLTFEHFPLFPCRTNDLATPSPRPLLLNLVLIGTSKATSPTLYCIRLPLDSLASCRFPSSLSFPARRDSPGRTFPSFH